MPVADEVKAILAEIEALGARVKLDEPSTDAEIVAAEAHLGFDLPEEYKEFLREIGGVSIEARRTWFFYGLPEKADIKALYVKEFDAFRGGEGGGAYYPARFMVVHDEGDFSNAAEGFVWDGDLGHLRATAGGDCIERSEFLVEGYWAFLSDQLEEIRDRIAEEGG
ncbi:SMI1/KNR4 family protein [Chondromyces crocatus]|uniref:Knr4/Smi1-like domain-containing protein n=1 Tax=Chondromyces crocatus TaxID=52 RepID=A0A0K1EQC1_CHOCO|nr:SMI1/KNR4 family protein [Chondromyces crocatus]AKT42852.1 uncharacterized protein CMC5_070800 [Chondromyces crocatus]